MTDNKLENCKDVFLSHSSRDKEPYVRKLAEELDRVGISYWLDQAEIKWGDKITKRINEGLRSSKYVIVFLSENFLGKNWPESELEAALNKENSDGKTVVLPILIGDRTKILDRYPLLQDKLYLEWDENLSIVSSHLTKLLDKSGLSDAHTQLTSSFLKESKHNTRTSISLPHNVSKMLLIGGSLMLLTILVIGIVLRFNRPNEAIQNSNVDSPVITTGEGRVMTDVNIRSGPSPTYEKTGLIEKDSIVRILSVNGRWFEVMVINRGRPKEESNSADRGWVDGRYIYLIPQ